MKLIDASGNFGRLETYSEVLKRFVTLGIKFRLEIVAIDIASGNSELTRIEVETRIFIKIILDGEWRLEQRQKRQ